MSLASDIIADGPRQSPYFVRSTLRAVPTLGVLAMLFGALGLLSSLRAVDTAYEGIGTSPITAALIMAAGLAIASYRPNRPVPVWRFRLAGAMALACLIRILPEGLTGIPDRTWSTVAFPGGPTIGHFNRESAVILFGIFAASILKRRAPLPGAGLLLLSVCALLAVFLQGVYGARRLGVDLSPYSYLGELLAAMGMIALYLRRRQFRVILQRSWIGLQCRLLLVCGIGIPFCLAVAYFRMIGLGHVAAVYGSYMIGGIVYFYVSALVLVSSRHELADEARRRAERRVREASRTDALTGTANRMGLGLHLAAAWRRFETEGAGFGIIMMDIDHFKRINDSLGHRAGDAVLRAVCQRIAPLLRAEDILGRWGGEEFLILVELTLRTDLVAISERLRDAVASVSAGIGAAAMPITASFGVSTFRVSDTRVEEAIDRADACLYAAKEAGRNRVALDLAA